MRRLRHVAAAMALGLSTVATASGPDTAATQLLDHLDAGQYQQAEALLSAQMKAAVPADKLKAVWESLPAQMGTARARGEAVISQTEGAQLVLMPLHYEKGQLQARFAIDADGKIAGFLVQPMAAPAPPPPADAPFLEQELEINAGPSPLPATLTLPKGKGPFPAVVLVHGSGPQDRDESVGPNRPFRDLAHGLAAKDIAVLRYEKRTRARPQDFSHGATLALESVDDAAAAVRLLATIGQIDPARVHVLGHSQGGMVAARIANAADVPVAGLILWAAPARPLLNLLHEQNVYLLGRDQTLAPEVKAKHLAELTTAIAAVRNDRSATLMGLPGTYWQELEQVDPVAETRASGLPVLVLQGGRDFQVIDADWQRWKHGLSGDRYRFHHYPALNHLGIAGEGAGDLREYEKPGHVDTRLINDIAHWIQRP